MLNDCKTMTKFVWTENFSIHGFEDGASLFFFRTGLMTLPGSQPSQCSQKKRKIKKVILVSELCHRVRIQLSVCPVRLT
jgi:hypothetical protein